MTSETDSALKAQQSAAAMQAKNQAQVP